MKKYRTRTIKRTRASNRSGRSPCDICSNLEILEQHHINGRDIPNPNHPSNLASICSNCHTKIHYGKIIIERWIQTSDGLKLYWHNKDEEGFTGEDSKPKLLI